MNFHLSPILLPFQRYSWVCYPRMKNIKINKSRCFCKEFSEQLFFITPVRSWKEIITKLQLLQSKATDWKFRKFITKNKNDYGGNIRSNDGKYLANTTDIWQILLTIVRSSRTQIFFKICVQFAWRPATLLQKSPTQVFSYEFWENLLHL